MHMKIASLARLITILTLTSSCTKIITIDADNSIPEVAYCTTNTVFPTSYTISGIAYYNRRQFIPSGLGNIDPTNFPIRRAEVQVLDSSGTAIQCTETDTSGNYSFTVPDDGA